MTADLLDIVWIVLGFSGFVVIAHLVARDVARERDKRH
ncbi:hypothetical protein SAMN06297251_105128 [Fulvimarina manganoxydans]|uniref:Uncharacterized protein n=1 Tax=Fulvimarina manganoxydans TaxID=937218 RepID=A0A1W2AW42_9HYPH|nr:hypothetical protein SAMN06297251_105128 [Fulvimarina manganoxydans]